MNEAAERTIEGRVPHSLHAYFLLPGDVDAPIVYQVERVRDGRIFDRGGRLVASVAQEGLMREVEPPSTKP